MLGGDFGHALKRGLQQPFTASVVSPDVACTQTNSSTFLKHSPQYSLGIFIYRLLIMLFLEKFEK